MAGKAQFISSVLLICILLFGGCGSLSGGRGAKVRLLRQIERKFENPDAHFELGQLYHADGLWAQAEHQYNIALSFDPAHRDAQAAMVKVLADSGDTTKSQLSAGIYMKQVADSAMGALQLGSAFQKQGFDKYALSCYQRALSLSPTSAEINKQMGYYYLSKNDKNRALEYLGRSFQLNPNQPEVAGELGRLGVAVRIPRESGKNTKLDKTIE